MVPLRRVVSASTGRPSHKSVPSESKESAPVPCSGLRPMGLSTGPPGTRTCVFSGMASASFLGVLLTGELGAKVVLVESRAFVVVGMVVGLVVAMVVVVVVVGVVSAGALVVFGFLPLGLLVVGRFLGGLVGFWGLSVVVSGSAAGSLGVTVGPSGFFGSTAGSAEVGSSGGFFSALRASLADVFLVLVDFSFLAEELSAVSTVVSVKDLSLSASGATGGLASSGVPAVAWGGGGITLPGVGGTLSSPLPASSPTGSGAGFFSGVFLSLASSQKSA